MDKNAALDWGAIRQARRSLIGNPYTKPEEVDAASFWFIENVELIAPIVTDLCARDLAGDARKVLLAAAHAAARFDLAPKWLPALEAVVDAARPLGLQVEKADIQRITWTLHRFNLAAAKLLGRSPQMQRLRETLWTACFGPNLFETLDHQAAIHRHNILILGEPGTGKELVAGVLQDAALADTKRRAPVQSVNCAAIPREVAEVELFGCVPGAFTGAQLRIGRITAADGGTLFLDEVADLALEVQAKLLSVIENGNVTPLGSDVAHRVDVRYVAATKRSLLSMVEKETFRDDLLGRLAGTLIHIPPLRERPEDIVEIGSAIVDELLPVRKKRRREGVSTSLFDPPDAVHDTWLEKEAKHLPWKGNVRALSAALRERVLGFSSSSHVEVSSTSGPTKVSPEASATLIDRELQRILNCEASEKEVVEWYMRRVLDCTGQNQTRAQDILGINRDTIRNRLQRRDAP